MRGVDDGAGGVQATRAQRNAVGDVLLRGRVEAFDAAAGTLTILGVVSPTDGRTEFENENDAPIPRDAFFSMLQVGSFVSAKDDADGDPTRIDVADEVEFEEEDDDAGFDRGDD